MKPYFVDTTYEYAISYSYIVSSDVLSLLPTTGVNIINYKKIIRNKLRNLESCIRFVLKNHF